MYKNYILPISACILTIVLMAGSIIYSGRNKSGDNLKYNVAFSAATVEQKIVGRHYTEIAQRYLPPAEITGKKRRGTFNAKYDGVRIFTPGDSHVIYNMTVAFKDSTAVALTLGEPSKKENFNAKVLNWNPLVFKLIDAEFGTRDISEKKGKANGLEIVLLLLLFVGIVILFGAGSFFIVWPLITLLAKNCNNLVSLVAATALLVAAGYFWFPFIAYVQGSVGLFLTAGVIIQLYALLRLKGHVNEALPCEYKVSHQSVINHLELLVMVAMYGEQYSGKRKSKIDKIRVKGGVSRREMAGVEQRAKIMLEDSSFNVDVPTDINTKKAFVINFAELLLCQIPIKHTLLNAAMHVTRSLDYNYDSFLNLLVGMASGKGLKADDIKIIQ